MIKDLVSWELTTLTKRLERKEVSAKEAIQAYLAEIAARDGEIGAYLQVTAETALKEAETADELRAKGETLPRLAGVPMAIKDNICTKGDVYKRQAQHRAEAEPAYYGAGIGRQGIRTADGGKSGGYIQSRVVERSS